MPFREFYGQAVHAPAPSTVTAHQVTGLISSERRGTWVYYRASPAVMARMSAVLAPPAALAGSAG